MSKFTLDMLVEGLTGEVAEWVEFGNACRFLFHLINLTHRTNLI